MYDDEVGNKSADWDSALDENARDKDGNWRLRKVCLSRRATVMEWGSSWQLTAALDFLWRLSIYRSLQ